MSLVLDYSIASEYKSQSQKARVVSEKWVADHLYCPICGNDRLCRYVANKPVADFYCEVCTADFELKSKYVKSSHDRLNAKVVGGAYRTMLERITSLNNLNLFLLHHDKVCVTGLILVPGFFFTPSIIEKRPPLKETARRAGWVGCTIHLSGVPQIGKIEMISNGALKNVHTVVESYQKSKRLQLDSVGERGWLMDVFLCVERLRTEFTLSDVYAYEHELSIKYPNNKHIRPKIRQQLQMLRDKGVVEFVGKGRYRRVN